MGGLMSKSSSWVVDHTMDDFPLEPLGESQVRHGSIVTGFETVETPEYEKEGVEIETPEERRGRKRSHYIIYTTCFIMAIGFSIVLTSVWPYLQKLYKDKGECIKKNALGYVIAANPLGQMVAAPLLGLLGNKLGKVRIVCLITVIMFILGNAMYSLLALFDDMGADAVYYAMIVSRFFIGVSAANLTLCRSYLAQSTTLKERTGGIVMIAAAQAIGYVVGPGIQTVLIMLVPEEVETGIWWLKWDEYTAAGWTAAILGFINLVLLMPIIFKEYNIAERERALMKKDLNNEGNLKLPKADHLALSGLLFSFFFTGFIYVLLEALFVPFVGDQYGWTGNKPQFIVGVALMIAGVLCCFVFALTGWLAKRYDERKVMLITGFIPIILGTALYLPYPGLTIPMQQCSNDTDFTTMSTTAIAPATAGIELQEEYFPQDEGISLFQQIMLTSENVQCDATSNCTGGCPQIQEWCNTVPQLPLPQLGVAFFVVMIGYPIAISINQGIYSKILGPKPQGFWMGILTAVGGLSRITGPIFVSNVYTELGTYWCFGILLVGMVLAFIELIFLYKRLVPMKTPTPKTQYAYDGPGGKPEANGTGNHQP